MADTISMYQGDQKIVAVTITNELSAAVDCSEATANKFTCYDTVGGSEQFQKTLADTDIVVSGAGNNVVTTTIEPADTTEMAAAQEGTSFLWDLEVTFSASNIQTFPRDTSGDPELGVLVLYGELS